MTITKDFKEAVSNKNSRMVRIMLKNSLLVDPTFVEFNEMISFAERNIVNLYDKHNNEILIYESNRWSKDYMDEQMVKLINNFSRERIDLLKKICSCLYRDKAEKIESNRKNSRNTIEISKKEVGTGLAVGGVIVAGVGIIITEPVIVVTGVFAGIVGGALIITDKKR